MTITLPHQPATGVPLESVAGAAGLRSPVAASAPRRKRRDAFIVATATLLGLWFGLSAPSVSPVAPPGVDSSVVSVAAGPLAGASAVPAIPVDPIDPIDPVDPAGQNPDRGDRTGQAVVGGRGRPDGGGRR